MSFPYAMQYQLWTLKAHEVHLRAKRSHHVALERVGHMCLTPCQTLTPCGFRVGRMWLTPCQRLTQHGCAFQSVSWVCFSCTSSFLTTPSTNKKEWQLSASGLWQSVSLHSFLTYFYLATRKNPDPQQGIILVSHSDEVKSCQTQCSVMQWIDQVELSAECWVWRIVARH